MKKIKLICVLCFSVFGVAAFLMDNGLTPVAHSYSSQPPPQMTGAPGEQNCSLCHDETGPGTIMIAAPANYIPGQTYQIQVQHATTDATRMRWGFELTALDGTNSAAGTFTDTTAFTQQDFGDGRFYIEHNQVGTFAGTPNGAAWTFDWNAPATNIGPVTFYAAGNQANNNDNPSGDQVYLTTSVSLGPTPSLGNYSNTSIALGANTTVAADAAPINTTSISISSSTNFKGKLEGNPITGTVLVTNAHPAGAYTLTVNAFGPGGTISKSFTLTVTTPPVCSPIAFSTPVNFITDSNPISIAIGDLNGDGKQDVITANDLSQNVSVALGDGTGGITSVTSFAAGANPSSLAVGDFNGDGKQDLAVANASSDSVSILAGNGSGGLGSPINIPAGIGLTSIAVGDLNGDGKQDLVVANASTDAASIVLGNGAGGFGPVASFPVGTDPKSVAIGDFNVDGKQDLVTANYNSDNVSILLGDGMGNFGAATNYAVASGTTSPTSVAIGDLNDDGKQDLAVANQFSGVSVFLGDGMGNFGAATNFSAGNQPYSIALGDFNNDGEQDVVLGKQGAFANITILPGNGTGSLGGVQFYNSAGVPWAVAVGDFNGDGKQDVAAANHDTFNVSILLSTCGLGSPTSTPTNTPTSTPTPADTPSISGVITYGNAIGNPVPPRFVRNVSVASTVGSPAVGPVITGTPGTYALTGFGAGSYTIKPTKPGGANTSVTSNDAARVAQGVSSSVPFVSLNQKFASDASGNGTVSSNDAALIARFAAGLTGTGNVGQWKFFTANLPGPPTAPLPTPPYNDSRTYASVLSSLTGEDFIALLIGEASGNYNPATHPRPVVGGRMSDVSEDSKAAAKPITVTVEPVVTAAEKEIVIPVLIDGAIGKEIISYEFELRYDPAVIQPLENPVDVAGTVSRGLMVVTNPYEPGLLRVVVYGPMPIDENGVLLNLRFTAIGDLGSASALTFDRIIFSDGEPSVVVSDGMVELAVHP